MGKYTALIIEPREHPALSYVINNFLHNLSCEWDFIVFHGINNKDYVMDIVNNLHDQDRFTLINLLVDNLDPDAYSDLFKKDEFYSNIKTETFLIFQTDTMILEKNKNVINIMLNYDYVGAPWPWHNNAVGNGGLSLRKKSKMLEIIKKKGYEPGNEDVYFSFVKNIRYNIPKYNIAKMFSVEGLFYLNPFGIHRCWHYLNEHEMAALVYKYPEIQELIDLQI